MLKKLAFLDISECRLVTADGIPELAALTGLTYLELREIKKVRDESFAALATLVNLTELNLEATRITSESVPVLLKLQKLERLFHAQVDLVAGHTGVPRILFHELQRPVASTLHGLARGLDHIHHDEGIDLTTS